MTVILCVNNKRRNTIYDLKLYRSYLQIFILFIYYYYYWLVCDVEWRWRHTNTEEVVRRGCAAVSGTRDYYACGGNSRYATRRFSADGASKSVFVGDRLTSNRQRLGCCNCVSRAIDRLTAAASRSFSRANSWDIKGTAEAADTIWAMKCIRRAVNGVFTPARRETLRGILFLRNRIS